MFTYPYQEKISRILRLKQQKNAKKAVFLSNLTQMKPGFLKNRLSWNSTPLQSLRQSMSRSKLL